MPKKYYDFDHIHQPDSYSNSELAGDIQERLDALEKIWFAAKSEKKAISNSRGRTAFGKQEAITELEVKVKKERETWLAAQDNLDDQINQIERGMIPERNRGDGEIGEMRKREIRDYLRTLKARAIEARYWVAAQADDELFLSAVEESPVPFPFVTQRLGEKVRLARLEEEARLDDLKLGKANVLSALKSVEADLKKQGLNIADDPLRDQEGVAGAF